MEGEIFVGCAQTSNEVVFECADGLFGSIAAMDVWRDQLIVHLFRRQKFLESLGCFVIQALEFWTEASGTKPGMRYLVGLEDRFRASVGEWDSEDTVAVIIVNDEDVIVTSNGRSDKFAGKIHVGLPGWCDSGGITEVCTVAVFKRRWESVSIKWWG